MKRLTVSVNEEQYAYLEERADPPDRSKAAVIRELIDAARSGEGFTGMNHGGEGEITTPVNAGDTTAVKSGDRDELLERIEAIEARLAEIAPADVDAAPIGAERTPDAAGGERAREHTAVESEATETTDDTTDSRAPSERDSRPVSESEPDDVLEAALAGWAPGQGDRDRERRREIGKRALVWLRDRHQPASKSTFQNALYEETHLAGQGERSWWERLVRDALHVAAENGYVDDTGRTYEWIEPGSGVDAES